MSMNKATGIEKAELKQALKMLWVGMLLGTVIGYATGYILGINAGRDMQSVELPAKSNSLPVSQDVSGGKPNTADNASNDKNKKDDDDPLGMRLFMEDIQKWVSQDVKSGDGKTNAKSNVSDDKRQQLEEEITKLFQDDPEMQKILKQSLNRKSNVSNDKKLETKENVMKSFFGDLEAEKKRIKERKPVKIKVNMYAK